MKAVGEMIIAGVLGSIHSTAAIVIASLFGVAAVIEACAKWREAGGHQCSRRIEGVAKGTRD